MSSQVTLDIYPCNTAARCINPGQINAMSLSDTCGQRGGTSCRRHRSSFSRCGWCLTTSRRWLLLTLATNPDQRGAYRHSFTFRDQQLTQCAAGRRCEFCRHLVSFDFSYRLTHLNDIVGSPEPAGYRSLHEGVSEPGHKHIGWHGKPLSAYRIRHTTLIGMLF